MVFVETQLTKRWLRSSSNYAIGLKESEKEVRKTRWRKPLDREEEREARRKQRAGRDKQIHT